MPRGIKTFVVLATTLMWMAVVIAALVRGEQISPALLGVPALVLGVATGADFVITATRKKTDGED